MAQDFSHISIEKADAGFRFTEGPVWSRDGFLLFSDVPNNVIRKLAPGERSTVFRDNSNGATGNALDAQGRLYICESRTRRVVRIDKKGNLEVLAEKWEGKRLNAPNDIIVRRDGHVYFTDPAFGDQADRRELNFYGVYHIPVKGPMSLVARPEGRPNGIALSPNGRILYVANSDERNIRAYDLDRNGEASNERILIAGIDGPPDGIRVDEKGNLYVAATNLPVYSPDGKLLHTLEFGERPANCAFGDPDLQTLYITARTSLYRVRLNVKGALQH
ncbi:MAG: SMP-30/gluconolactonase/LRE family protein [Acidobacteria bacterium]|nr:SMP-30/gluconolactonase/LRE family protein [Acidobacteriota bacterium]MBI3470552.1 SMP-30/gluconolactonase/LRE family protein [Candidatus Solibacter usitatus]